MKHYLSIIIAALLLLSTIGVASAENPFTAPPTDPDVDGLYEDVNGNGVMDYNDIVSLFEAQDYLFYEVPAMIPYFDFNGNGGIDFNDLIVLFGEIGAMPPA